MRIIDDFSMYSAGSGTCYLCGNVKGANRVIDLDRQTEGAIGEPGGELQICWMCAEQLASLIGCASESETKRLRGRVRNLEDEKIQLEMELQAVTDRVRSAVA